jgi:hypothetical protein
MKRLIPDEDRFLIRTRQEKKPPDNRAVPIAEAIARLGDGAQVKTFFNPKADVFLPQLYRRIDLIGRFYRQGVHDAGPAAMGLGYTLVLLSLDGDTGTNLFIEAAPPAPRKDAMTRRQIAELCHEVNRAYCTALGDTSQPPWASAPEWQTTSAVDGVLFHLAHPDATPEESHATWRQAKEADGWTFGPVKDAQKKEHPCIVPYAQLPVDQRAKDHLFIAVVRHCAAIVGVTEDAPTT